MKSDKIGILYIVSTPIGNLKDITLRAIDVLQSVNLIAAEDTRHSSPLLKHYSINTPVISMHNYNEHERSGQIISRIQQGQSIALISDAGTPLISDPGYHLVKKARLAGIKVVPIPGASALIAALTVSGFATDKFVFEGFLSSKSKQRKASLEAFVSEFRTIILYESPHRIIDLLCDMKEVLGGQREVGIARELTKVFETIKTGSIDQVIDFVKDDKNQQKGEFVVIVKGNSDKIDDSMFNVDRVLPLLLECLPVKKAAEITASITNSRKNEVYKYALELKNKT